MDLTKLKSGNTLFHAVSGAFWAGLQDVHYGWEQTEVIMGQKTFFRVAGALFLLITLGHLLRIAFGASVVVQNVSIPMWVSFIAPLITGYLAYQGFRLARKSLSRV